jgi:integrase
MAHIQKRGAKRWVARYADPEGNERAKSFLKKSDAEKFLASVQHTISVGGYVDPSLGRLAVGEWAAQWLAAQGHLKPAARERYASTLRTHVLPRWAEVSLSNVGHAAVQAWCSTIATTKSPSAAVKAHRVLSLVLDLAVKDGRLVRNPAHGVSLPREAQTDRRYLSHEQVLHLAEAAGDYRVAVLFLAYTGCRFGEMAALRVHRIDPLRRRVEIAESVTAVNGHLEWGTPKGHARRWVSVPRFVADELAAHTAGKLADALVFTSPRGAALRASNFRRDVFTPAVRKAGLQGATPHSLRHTAASLAIASGANVKVVQSMLGHKSATLTLDLYGHLFADQLDQVANAMDEAAREAHGRMTDTRRTEGEIVALDSKRNTSTAQ